MTGGAAAAFEPMQVDECQDAWAVFADGLAGLMLLRTPDDAGNAQHLADITWAVTPDGWCRWAAETGADFSTLDWQAEGIAGYINDRKLPVAMRLRAFEMTGAAKPYSVAATLRQVPDAALLLVEDFQLSDSDGTYLSASAVIGGAYLETMASAQMSFGGLRLTQFAARINVTPARLSDAATPELFDQMPAVLTDMLAGLDQTQLPDGSRVALTALMDDLPAAHGALDIQASSAQGLGMMQIAGAQSLAHVTTRADIIGFALSGVQIAADWIPVE